MEELVIRRLSQECYEAARDDARSNRYLAAGAICAQVTVLRQCCPCLWCLTTSLRRESKHGLIIQEGRALIQAIQIGWLGIRIERRPEVE